MYRGALVSTAQPARISYYVEDNMACEQVDAAVAITTELRLPKENVQLKYSVPMDVRNVSFGTGSPVNDRANAEVRGTLASKWKQPLRLA